MFTRSRRRRLVRPTQGLGKLLLLLLIARSAMAQQHYAMADLIITNAAVRTMDSARPVADAIAVAGNRILALGKSEEMEGWANQGTRVLDAGGRLILPGFNDAHVHFLSGGFQLSQVNLRDAASPDEFTRRLREAAATNRLGRWITGGDWDHERWPGAPLPTKAWADAASTNHPIFVRRLDGHMAVANTLALQIAGISRKTKAPAGGEIVRFPKTGEPTGLLKDAAMELIYRVIPSPTFEEKLEAARAASRHAASLGVTSVQDMSAGGDVGVYQELMRRGELLTRVYAVWPLPGWQDLAKTGMRAGFGNDWLRVGGLKGFSDGSLGSSTAWFFQPYDDAPGTSGLPSDEMVPKGAMADRVRKADRAGLQVMVHAIGDKANDTMLKIFEETAGANGPRDRRFRIEHAQHLRLRDIPRFAAAGVIASMQPYHAADDGRWAEKRIGKQRCRGTYAFRSLLDSGAELAFGSDWTVAPLDPIQGVAAAVTRRTLDGKHPGGWIPEEKISVEEAVRAYTVGSARAEFTEPTKGKLAPGYLADMVVLSRDIFRIDPVEIEKTKVLLTVVDGKVVYQAKSFGRTPGKGPAGSAR